MGSADALLDGCRAASFLSLENLPAAAWDPLILQASPPPSSEAANQSLSDGEWSPPCNKRQQSSWRYDQLYGAIHASFFFFFPFLFLNWGAIDLQYHKSFRCMTQWFTIFKFMLLWHQTEAWLQPRWHLCLASSSVSLSTSRSLSPRALCHRDTHTETQPGAWLPRSLT